ncbi:MAG TPA: hypothetical protein VFE05_10735 [Longimicrobiaceae bacterium]|jgi:hypothetical protein|nr:hypothetical protein [Longimicrobiaceae bacterium]
MAAVVVLLGGCATVSAASQQGGAEMAPVRMDVPHFKAVDGLALGHPRREMLVNVGAGPRVDSAAAYERFWRDVAPSLERWAAQPEIRINPNFAAALLTKESGFEAYALSNAPANGLPQITAVADREMLDVVHDSPRWQWARAEVESWPRHPAVHDTLATRARTQRLIASGAVTGANEYLFSPLPAVRAALIWLRMLEDVWTLDEWPGRYGSLARSRINGGAPLSDSQLLDLVTVSYNAGYEQVADSVKVYGPRWPEHVNPEAKDYLERIRAYTVIYQQARQ